MIMKRTIEYIILSALLLSCGKEQVDEPGKEPEVIIPEVHAVDLGLSVKWADANVGAANADEYGYYYAWGETVPKDDYTWKSYKWSDGSSTSMKKYCTSKSYGAVDNLTVLAPEDDICAVAFGGQWRMPNEQEWKELQSECTWEKWEIGGAFAGYKVKSKKNDNYIILPVAGGWEGNSVHRAGYTGFYWASELYENKSCYAKVFQLVNGSLAATYGSRSFGLPVRAVLAE